MTTRHFLLWTALLTAGTASAQTSLKAEFTTIVGDPTSSVPGLPGVSFQTTGEGDTFDQPYGSPNGNYILTAFVETTGSDYEVLLVNGTAVLQKGDAPPWPTTGTEIDNFSSKVGINDAGQYTFISVTGPAFDDTSVIRFDGATYSVVAGQGDAVPAMPGVSYATLQGPVISAAGDVGFEADSLTGLGSAVNNALFLGDGAAIVARNGTTIPGNQSGGASAFAQNFDTEDFFVTPDGAHTLWQGDLEGSSSSDDVLVYDGNVVIHEGAIIAGSGFPNPVDSSGIRSISLDAAGNWFAHGDNDVTDLDWIVRSGAVIAAVGQPVTPGSTELWSDANLSRCFIAMLGNGNGDYLVGGETDATDLDANDVLVFNGTDIVLREGDPIDLDGNGLYDDDLFITDFDDYEFFFTNDRVLYFNAYVDNGAGSLDAQALLRLEIDGGCGPVASYGAGCDGSGGFVPTLGASGCAAAGGTFTLEIDNALGGSSALLFIGLAPANLPIAGGCSLLLSPLPVTPQLPLFGAGPGNGAIAIPSLLPPNATGLSLYLQALVIDGGVPRGYAATSGLNVTFP